MLRQAKKYRKYVILYLKGFAMGIADVIPGVSGGTIAFIFGIYEELILSIKSFDLKFLKSILRLNFKYALRHAAWPFLIAIFAGIISAIFSFSKVVTWLLANEPVLINAFFFGLILATVPVIARQIKRWNPALITLGTVVTILMYWLVGLVPIRTPETAWFLFLSGAIAICAMILPGISGSFILLLIGKYEYIITAVSERDIFPLIIVALGCAVGITSFVRVINWLFMKFHDITLVILTGLVIGSLRKIWPWKHTLEYLQTSKGKIIPVTQVNILPEQLNGELAAAVFICLCGFFIALKIGSSPENKLLNHGQ